MEPTIEYGNHGANGGFALVFPGQASQAVGMGRELYESSPVAREVFAIADQALGEPLSRWCFEGPLERLSLTEITQPAVLTVSIAAYRALGIAPSLAAGHSLGEYSALVAAGVLDFAETLKVVRMRGRFMQEAAPAGIGAMYAVIGNDLTRLPELIAEHGEGQVEIANFNSSKQVVISGLVEPLRKVVESLKGLRAMKLSVSAPFHCRLMQPAADRLAPELARLHFNQPLFPIIRNIDAAAISSAEEAREGLLKQVRLPVQWHASIRRMIDDYAITTFVEVGPGKVLTGLIGQIDPTVRKFTVQTLQEAETVRGELTRMMNAEPKK